MEDGREAGSVTLRPMTRELCHALYREYERDPDTFMDMSLFEPFVYEPEWVERYIAKQERQGSVVFAIMLGGKVVGEVKLKRIDRERQVCAMGIHLQNDRAKNRGIGTRAERLALQYAFEVLGMEAVEADAVHKNKRSQHVMEKVGFRPVGEDEVFRYYRIDRRDFAVRSMEDGI